VLSFDTSAWTGAEVRSALALALGLSPLCVGALAGGVIAACGSTSPGRVARHVEDEADRCVLALRFVSDDAEDRLGSGASLDAEGAPGAPTTELSLVRICDQNGRIVRSLGTQAGVCQHAPEARGTLVSARCWWPGHTGVSLRMMREGQRVFVVALEESSGADPVTLGAVEVPARAHLEVLAPGRARP
jgi:hypothetical protein